MKKLDAVTHEDFETCLNQTFTVTIEGEIEQEFELIEVRPFGEIRTGVQPRQPFSLLFRGPMEPVLAQSTYPLENPAIGALSLFLVPIGPDDSGMLYDVTFN